MSKDRQGAKPRFMVGVPELLVLQLLREREMYGYELVAEIGRATGGELHFAEGVIYPLLHALADDGLLRRHVRRVDGRSRIYYTATARGLRRLAGHVQEWRRVGRAVAAVLGERGDGHVPAT